MTVANKVCSWFRAYFQARRPNIDLVPRLHLESLGKPLSEITSSCLLGTPFDVANNDFVTRPGWHGMRARSPRVAANTSGAKLAGRPSALSIDGQ